MNEKGARNYFCYLQTNMSDRPSGSRDRDPDEEADVVLVDSNQTGQDRERALIAKLPDKEGSQLKKEEIQCKIQANRCLKWNI